MRSADAVTFIRVGMIIAAAYLILIKFDPVLILLVIAAAMLLDAVDGYFAVREASRGKVGFMIYLNASLGDRHAASTVRRYKKAVASVSKFGARMDVAGDRAVEYILWITYTYVNVIPLFVIFIIVLRHSFVDAVMAARGTSSKMKTKFAKIVYSSNIWRGGINVVKFITFGYLAFAYVWGYPLWIGYLLTAILVLYILLRGAAEVYEAYHW
jgi:phosphatidylglycerophosphate synthase